ncbi:hypothetical protein C8J57DRAFT_1249406 [Mycena rebaudengoi]|nr:hypothetical protein C8J57DRAFT_1249406 [Mycena rebaudengoi]
MTKNSVARPKPNTPDEMYTPTVNTASVREKRRLQMAEKAAAKKLKRRQWDPPKKQAAPLSLDSVNHDDAEGPAQPIVFRDYHAQSSSSGWNEDVSVLSPASERGAALGSSSTSGAGDATGSPSPTAEEHLASHALLTLADVEVEGENESSNDSIFDKAMDLSSLGSRVLVSQLRAFERYTPTQKFVNGSTTYSASVAAPRDGVGANRVCGRAVTVQAAQIRIFSLNSRDLPSATEVEMERWVLQRFRLCTRLETRNPYLSSRTQTFIGRWTVKVFTAVHHRGQSSE